MPSTFLGLDIARSGIYAAQAGLRTTAHNISNENTDGYSRQVTSIEAGNAMRVYASYGMVGTGVVVTGITQVRDTYYDVKHWNNEAKLHEYSAKENYTMQIEDYFNEVDVEGFTKEYENLFATLKSMQANPSSLTYRTEFLSYAQSISDYFNDIQEKLSSLQQSANTEVSNMMDRMNIISAQIASINQQINTVELTGKQANDLRDKRALMLDELSAIIPINVTETGDKDGRGHFKVECGGFTLVNDYYSHQFTLHTREDASNPHDIPGLYDIYYYYDEDSESATKFDVQAMGLSGELRATLDVRDGNSELSDTAPVDYKGIPFYYEKIQEFKETLAKSFNELHQNATRIDADGNEVPANYNLYGDTTEDIPIFVLSENGKLSVNIDLVNDPGLLATSSYPIHEGLDDAGLLEKMLELKEADIYRSGNATEYLESITAEIAVDSKKSENFARTYENIQLSIKNQRLAISGVDSDEETMNMVKYQEAFELAAKMISVMQQIYDKLINQTGI